MRPRAGAITVAIVVAAWTAAVALASTGCETFTPSTCDLSLAGNPFVTYTGGKTTHGAGSDYAYASSTWGQELLHLPGGTHYALATQLPCAPSSINLYLSFDSTFALDAGTLAPAAGNEVLILGVEPPDDGGAQGGYTIQVASNSCADFWLLVTASATCSS